MYDAIIIGGGIAGVSAMFFLSKAGKNVLLLEKGTMACGSTGRCIGGIRAQFTSETKIKVMKQNLEFYKNFKDNFGHNIEWHPGGYLVLAHNEKHVENLRKSREYCNINGLNVKHIDPNDCRKIVAGMNIDGLKGANYNASDGQANPFYVIKALIRMSKADIRTHMKVTGIEKSNGKVIGVIAEDDNNESHSFKSPVVINAAGPDALEIADMAGIKDIPFWNERHEALITEPVARMFDPLIIDQRAIEPFSANSYFVQAIETNQIIGCFTPFKKGKFPDFESDYPNFLSDKITSSKEFLIEASERMINVLPKLKNIRIRRHWAGVYPMTYSGCPIIDKTELDGFYLSIGYCGHGFMLGPICGKLLSEMILNRKPSIDLSDWSLEKARWLRDNKMTLEQLG